MRFGVDPFGSAGEHRDSSPSELLRELVGVLSPALGRMASADNRHRRSARELTAQEQPLGRYSEIGEPTWQAAPRQAALGGFRHRPQVGRAQAGLLRLTRHSRGAWKSKRPRRTAVLTRRMRFVVASHGHCFDGLSSAVLFTRLMHERGLGQAQFEYKACGYGMSQQRAEEKLLVGDENAILDYRFSGSPKLTWYFDHHRTAFHSDAERDAFEATHNPQFFFDATYSSCTKLIADKPRRRSSASRIPIWIRWCASPTSSTPRASRAPSKPSIAMIR